MQPAFTQRRIGALALPGALLLAALLFIAMSVTGFPDLGSVMSSAGVSLLMSAGAP